ncbi:MAG TPA: hypothetical protein VGC06_18895 [Actinomycetes bacterium]
MDAACRRQPTAAPRACPQARRRTISGTPAAPVAVLLTQTTAKDPMAPDHLGNPWRCPAR